MGVKKGHRFGARNQMKLTTRERSLIVGSLLGDASICPGSTGVSARVQVRHSLAQKDLVFWKYEMLKRLVRTPPRTSPNRGYNKRGQAVAFSTVCLGELAPIREEFWKRGSKQPTVRLMEQITHPVGLAAWYMDDGSRPRGSSIVLHTESFDKIGHEVLRQFLWKQFKIEAVTRPTKRGFLILSLDADNGEKFMGLVRRYVKVVPSMERKILAKREDLFCPMCGEQFEATRRQISKSARVITCRRVKCQKARDRMFIRVQQDRGSYTI